MVADKIKLLAIVGPTASGKTDLAIKAAKRLNGEIISADSRAQYQGMDIGTAKPSYSQRQGIKHWCIDLSNPKKPINVNDFKSYADKAIKDILTRNKLPILIGGSGLYIDAVLYDYKFAPTNKQLRQELSTKTIDELQLMIQKKNLKMPENLRNKRYLIRTIEVGSNEINKSSLLKGSVIIGLNPGKEELKKRIEIRINKMIKDGLYKEIKQLREQYKADSEPMKANAYRAFTGYIDGSIDEETAITKAVKADMSLVKKQLTWFKRNKDIAWFNSADKAYKWLINKNQGKL